MRVEHKICKIADRKNPKHCAQKVVNKQTNRQESQQRSKQKSKQKSKQSWGYKECKTIGRAGDQQDCEIKRGTIRETVIRK